MDEEQDRARGRTTRPSADPTRDRILAAAIDLFAERSFEGATTRAIAAEAGVTQPLLNYHFRSKDELWRSAVDVLFERLTSSMQAHEGELQGVDELTAAKASLAAGDIVLTLDGARPPAVPQLVPWVGEHRAGTLLAIEVLRDGKPLKLSANWVERLRQPDNDAYRVSYE